MTNSISAALPEQKRLSPRGVYLITGGLGGLGLVLAEHLGRMNLNARLVLVSRSDLPSESECGSLAINDATTGEAVTASACANCSAFAPVSGSGLVIHQADVTSVDEIRLAIRLPRTVISAKARWCLPRSRRS